MRRVRTVSCCLHVQETDKDENEYSRQFATVLSSLLVRDPKSRCGVAEAKDMFLDRAFSGVT